MLIWVSLWFFKLWEKRLFMWILFLIKYCWKRIKLFNVYVIFVGYMIVYIYEEIWIKKLMYIYKVYIGFLVEYCLMNKMMLLGLES